MNDTTLTVQRPWGRFIVLDRGDRHQLKLLVVDPWQRLSLQRHFHRAEHWHVLSGSAVAELAQGPLALSVGDSVDIAVQVWHRLGNAGPSALVVVEAQHGTYLGEDDIERADSVAGMP